MNAPLPSARPPTQPTPRPPDPFLTRPIPEPPSTPGARTLALCAAVVLAALVILWQNIGVDRQHRALGLTPPPAPVQTLVYNPLEPGPMMGKFAARLPSVFQADPTSRAQMDAYAATTADRIVLAIALGEPFGVAESAARLAAIQHELEATAPVGADHPDAAAHAELTQDVRVLRAWYAEQEAAGTGSVPEADAWSRLEARYGYFARLAKTVGDKASAQGGPLRAGGVPVMVGLVLFGLVVIVAALAGLVLFVVGLVRLSTGRLRLRGGGPVRTSGVFLETYAIFVGGFLLMTVGSTVLGASAWGQDHTAMVGVVTLIAQWCLLVTPLWPLLRGMAWLEYRTAIGLHAGAGVLREVWAGVVGYLAGLPLFFAGVLVTLVVVLVQQAISSGPAEPPSNDILDLIVSADALTLFLIVTLATVWAPVCEELIFRGALYRHLRGRAHWVGAGLLSAGLFAYMHSYGPLMVAPLIALGFTFSFMREWRGSIIAPVTAHALHNGTLMAMMLTVLRPLLA